MNNMLKIGFIFSNRSEYGELEPFIEFFKSKIKVEKMDLSKNIKKIDDDKNLSKVYDKCYDFFHKKKLNIVCILGDRREIPFIALAAFHLNVKIIHIAAGEKIDSSSSYDQFFRPMVSILSSYQICFSEVAKKEVKKLFNGISYLESNAIVLGNPIFSKINIKKLQRPIKENYDLVLLHPQSLSRKKTYSDVKLLGKKLSNKKTIFILGNNDKNSDVIKEFYETIRNNKNYKFVKSFEKKKYFQYVKFSDKFFTNSSSIHEIELLNKNALTIIGDRNKNRSKEKFDNNSPKKLYDLLKN